MLQNPNINVLLIRDLVHFLKQQESFSDYHYKVIIKERKRERDCSALFVYLNCAYSSNRSKNKSILIELHKYVFVSVFKF